MESSETFDTWTLVTNKETDSPNTPASSTSLNTDSDIDNRIENLQEDHNNNDRAEEAETLQEQHLQIVEKSLEPLNSNTDDLSDGISIISGSESPGRLSPHPDLRDHLQDFNLKFATHNDFVLNEFKPCIDTVSGVEILPIANPEQDLRQRGKTSKSISGKEMKALQKASQTTNTTLTNEDTPPILKRGLHGVFYVGVVLGIFALLGQIKNPPWQSKTQTSNTDLVQKLNDMEMQNNLMRAEIDLLNKQVKYLSTVDEQKKQRKKDKKSPAYEPQQQQQPKRQQQQQQQHKRKPSFKAWPGIGDAIKPMDATKEDLKTPHKCKDGSYVELAGMCAEMSSTNEPTIPEQLGHNINNLRKHSDLIENLEEMSEKPREFIHNPYDKLEEVIKDNWKMRKEETKGKTDLKRSSDHGYKEKNYNHPDYNNENNKHSKTREYQNSSNNYGKIQQQQQQEVRYDKSKEYIKGRKFRDDDKSQQERKRNFNSKEKNTPINSFKSQQQQQQQQQQQHNKHRNNSKERKSYNNDIDEGEVHNYDSKERFNNYRKTQQYDKQYKDNSKERKSYDNEKEQKEKFNYNSKEGKNGRRSYDSKEEYAQERYGKEAKRKGNDGIWHLNYMKNRETARQEKEHKMDKDKNKNWFIERANSREMKRVSDETRLR